MPETIKDSDLLSLNFSIKPPAGNSGRRQVATPVTSGYVCNEGQSYRPAKTREAPLRVFTLAASCLAPGVKGEQYEEERSAATWT